MTKVISLRVVSADDHAGRTRSGYEPADIEALNKWLEDGWEIANIEQPTAVLAPVLVVLFSKK